MKILIIEDEQLLADSIAEVLRRKGFEAEAVYDGETGAEYAELGVYDLLILDVMMPGLDGYTVARQVRARHLGTPILMLTARSGLEDRITGLNAGADYYLTKPFDTRELLACVNALLRRQGAQVNQLTLGNTSLDLSTAALSCGAGSIRLSAREFDIMRLLLQAGERNLSKAALLERVWGHDSDAVENHVEVYVCFLRKKLASIGSNIRIESIRRLGYHLEVSGDEEALRRVLEILLDNAQKYSSPGGETQVTLHRRGRNHCALTVANQGEPIPPEARRQIFQRFYRADPARSRNGSFGLGLSIAEGIVAQHHGTIDVTCAGGFNRFWAELPCRQE